ncbi:hypothetical protein P8452_46792 [Trifolium repens]|nr:hypothetical protein QL285_074974 [Trifolium repens]WJX61726.1 hypothetical protein P8452_46792 [Trifolium repens]
MKARIVRKYFVPTLLRSVNTLCPPTLASEIMGTSMYHLNTSVGGTSAVTISTKVFEADMYSKHPIAIYAVSKVLLHIDIFGSYVPPPPPLHSRHPPLLSPQMSLVAARTFFL